MLLKEPVEIVTTRTGSTFRISKYDCITGREIMFKYPISNLPQLGEYKSSEEIAMKSMSFVEKKLEDGRWIRLDTPLLVKQHVYDALELAELEWNMLKYNFDFFQNGATSRFIQSLGEIAEAKVIKILTNLLDMWLKRNSRRTTSSKLSIQ